MNYVFAGDRDISLSILSLLIEKGFKPRALMITERFRASHADELVAASGLGQEYVLEGNEFRTDKGIELLKSLEVDYIFGIHFPYLVPKSVLEIPKVGFLNLHPAFLPYNKGWHTPSWAIVEGTPYGATLHFMAEELDAGEIIHQKECLISPDDTANSLYQKVKKVEIEVFEEALETLVSLSPERIRQENEGTSHLKKHLKNIQKLDLESEMKVSDLLNKLRGLTTNNLDEAAFFEANGRKFAIQVKIVELPQ